MIEAGRARQQGRAELFQGETEASCFRRLAAPERGAWDRAVDHYMDRISPLRWSDREQMLLRTELAGIGDRGPISAEDRRFVEETRELLSAAVPAYETCHWHVLDSRNRQWIEAVTALLAVHESVIALQLERLYRKPWDGLPIPIDVVETANGNANSILTDPGGHILISSTDDAINGHTSLEMVYHEASHLLSAPWRGDPLPEAIEQAADRLGVAVPDGLWHVVLFYMTGETVRRVLQEAGIRDYTPYVYSQGLFERGGGGTWRRYRAPIESAWPAYLEGERTLADAAADLIRRISNDRTPR